MGWLIDEEVYQYIYNLDIADGEVDDLFEDEDGLWFTGSWEDYGLEQRDGSVYTISTRPSQDSVFIGNYEG